MPMHLRPLTGLLRCRWLRWGLCTVGWPLLGPGCGPPMDIASRSSRNDTPALVSQSPQNLWSQLSPGDSRIETAKKADSAGDSRSETAKKADATDQVVQASHEVMGPDVPPAKVEANEVLPIDLETVLRLAEEQNAQIGVARHKVGASMLSGQSGVAAWLPKVTAGMAYYRHEGGIQNPDGTFVQSSTGAFYPGLDISGLISAKDIVYQRVNAERQHWQGKADLSKVTNEVLLEATATYIDLLTARRAEAIASELLNFSLPMLKRAEDLKKTDPSASVIYESLQVEVMARRQELSKLRQQGDGAAAKLGYLLGLPPCIKLMPVEAGPAPIDVVDVAPCTEDLVGMALANGPGMKEIQGLLAVIQAGMAELEGPINFLPALQMDVYEGPFWAGPGSELTGDNRFDAGLQARWNITELLCARQKKALARNQIMQVELAKQDLEAKLTSGVEEARSAILAGREQLSMGREQLQHASEAYRLAELAVKVNAPGATTTAVMQAIRALEQSHLSYLAALSAHNKAEIRLLLFLGPGNGKKNGTGELCPVPPDAGHKHAH